MTINNKSGRNYRGKCLGWPVTSYGGAKPTWKPVHGKCLVTKLQMSHKCSNKFCMRIELIAIEKLCK